MHRQIIIMTYYNSRMGQTTDEDAPQRVMHPSAHEQFPSFGSALLFFTCQN